MKHNLRIWHKIIVLALFIICVLYLSACTTYKLEVSNVSLYNEGVQIVDSVKPKSKVRLEVGQKLVGTSSDIPLALFVSAMNLSESAVIFDKHSVSVSQQGRILRAFTDDELKKSNADFSSIIESYHLYIPPTPVPNQPVMTGVPLFYRGYMGGFYLYNEVYFSARERMRRQIELDDLRMRRAVIVSSALQKNTLQPKAEPRGGFVIYPFSQLKAGELDVRVKVGDDEHYFMLKLIE